MKEPIQQIISRLEQFSEGQKERQTEIENLSKQILKSRRVARLQRTKQQLAGIDLEIYDAADALLRRWITDQADRNALKFKSEAHAQDWAAALLNRALVEVLTAERLQDFAIAVQSMLTVPQNRLAAGSKLEELIEAIRIAKVLPFNRQELHYQDALSKTQLWLCSKLDTFDPKKGSFTAWLSYRFKMCLIEAERSQTDRFTETSKQGIIRKKYRFAALLSQVEMGTIAHNLKLCLRQYLIEPGISLMRSLGIFGFLLTIQHIIHKTPALANQLLYEIVQSELDHSAEVTSIDQVEGLENHITDNVQPSLSEVLRQYIEEDPNGYCQKSMKSCSGITFQKIAIARLNGKTWQKLSEKYGAGTTALSNFYQRTLQEIAPKIQGDIQDYFSLQ